MDNVSASSDFMLYTNIADLNFKDKRQNGLSFIYQMSRTAPRCFMDRGAELALWADNYKTRIPVCTPCTATRGGNHPGCQPNRSCPKPEYSPTYLKDFLLVPCPKPTYKNHIMCNEEKCFSKRHQLFNNMTKRH